MSGVLPDTVKIPVNGYKKLKEYFLCELGGKIKQPAETWMRTTW